MKNKYLYITDLDGTLLNSEKALSKYARDTINALIENGVHFSIATARTAASTTKILSGLNIDIPVVLMNGAAVFDMKQKKYIRTEEFLKPVADKIHEVIKSHGISGFMYGIAGDELTTYYENLNTRPLQEFHDERVKNYYKSFEQVDSFSNHTEGKKIVYFCLIDERDRLAEAMEDIKELQGVDAVLYREIYKENLWYLEVYSESASKYNATGFIREYCGFDRIIGFGDNVNDIPLLKACDEFFAVSNAVEELKELADGIIGDNHSDGVVRFIADRESKD